MPQSSVLISTTNASRYLQQLCKHWAHHFEVSLDAGAGTVGFGEFGQVRFQASPDHLSIAITAKAVHLEETRRIIEDHLQRFARKEALEIKWSTGVE